jgi:hypothetical protein
VESKANILEIAVRNWCIELSQQPDIHNENSSSKSRGYGTQTHPIDISGQEPDYRSAQRGQPEQGTKHNVSRVKSKE